MICIENEDLCKQIYQVAMDAGFDDCGIISLEDMDGYVANTMKRVEAVPESNNFYRGAIQSVAGLKDNYPWAKSIVVCVSRIGKCRFPEKLEGMYIRKKIKRRRITAMD